MLRFDMNAMRAMTEKYGDYSSAMAKMQESKVTEYEIVLEIFGIMASAGERYLAEVEGRKVREIDATGLMNKFSSPGKLKGIVAAIYEAVEDGTATQSGADEDDKIRDGYLQELQEAEKRKN